MSDWIELNLPFDIIHSFIKTVFPNCPDLSERAKEELGMTPEENYNRYKEWQSKQPEWIEYNKEYNRIQDEKYERLKTMSFVGMDLNKVGTLIEVEIDESEDDGEVKVKTEQYLIGHINENCGVCDDCTAFNIFDTIVKRYKVVWSPGKD
jgi:hypothetical protein